MLFPLNTFVNYHTINLEPPPPLSNYYVTQLFVIDQKISKLIRDNVLTGHLKISRINSPQLFYFYFVYIKILNYF